MESAVDYRALAFFLSMAQAVGYLILGLYVWFSSRQKATRSEIGEVREAVESLRSDHIAQRADTLLRAVKIEEFLKNAPTHNDISKVYGQVNTIRGTVDKMSGMLHGLTTHVNLLVEYHIKREKNDK